MIKGDSKVASDKWGGLFLAGLLLVEEYGVFWVLCFWSFFFFSLILNQSVKNVANTDKSKLKFLR